MQTMRAVQQSGGSKKFTDREFPMSDGDFNRIKELAKQRTGIELGDHKKEMIYSRIVRRIRSLSQPDFNHYLNYLESNLESELTNFINAITTNLTSFYREPHHFDYLTSTALPEIMKKKAQRRLRIWSAGCSTGEEAYTLAITLNNALGKSDWNAKILATDLDTNVIQHGREGIYTQDRVGNLDTNIVRRNFDEISGGREPRFKIKPHIQQLITFNRLNLLGDWPMKGKFDVIFCRNVVIYFSKDTQRKLFDRYADILEPDGYLFIGHSETLHGVTKRFSSIGKTIYRKVN